MAMTSPDEPFVAFDLDSSDRELAHLAGHTIEDLSDYLDRGRTPADPTIDDSPECQIALRSLQRLRTVQRSQGDLALGGVVDGRVGRGAAPVEVVAQFLDGVPGQVGQLTVGTVQVEGDEWLVG